MFQWLRRVLRRSASRPVPVIAADITGFTLTAERHSRAIPWQSVSRIAAFKQDLLTHDRIVLLVQVAGPSNEVLSLPEDSPGFAGLFGPMEEALGINPAWYLRIMTPAFEPTPHVLYVRPEEVR